MQSNTQTMSLDQLVGQLVGQYRVESLLGQGRLSAVYLARHLEHQQTVALTVFPLPERFTQDARTRFLQRFKREAAALTMLTHRNLLPIQEYGERFGYPYLVTPHMTHGSLVDVLKQQERLSPAQALTVLEQAAAGLEYIHRKNVVHGTLKTSNILRNDEQTFLVAGVGLASLLQLRGIEPTDQPYAHLLSVADTFLYASAYVAPEVVQGQQFDTRSDIYALGVILFELLCGRTPFAGSSPLETALQHVEQPMPSLRAYCPDIPIALELVVQHALARNPEQRFQHVSELVEAFSQVCHGLVNRLRVQRDEAPPAPLAPMSAAQKSIHDLPEEEVGIGNWQLKPPIVTGKTASVRPTYMGAALHDSGSTDAWQILPPIITGRIPAVKTTPPGKARTQSEPKRATEPLYSPSQPLVAPVPQPQSAPLVLPAAHKQVQPAMPPKVESSRKHVEPSAAMMSMLPETPRQVSPALTNQAAPLDFLATSQASHVSSRHSRGSHGSRGRKMSRRKVVALLATGSVAAAGALIALDVSLTHHAPGTTANTTTHKTGTTNQTGKTKGTTKGKTTKTTGGTTTKQVGHTGTVVGQTQLALNSSLIFTNPADGKESLLIHLPGGQFVAYERACTHEGVAVNYNAATHTIICPAHNSIFDPANGAKVLQGPAATPLTTVTVRVNGDGTITTA